MQRVGSERGKCVCKWDGLIEGWGITAHVGLVMLSSSCRHVGLCEGGMGSGPAGPTAFLEAWEHVVNHPRLEENHPALNGWDRLGGVRKGKHPQLTAVSCHVTRGRDPAQQREQEAAECACRVVAVWVGSWMKLSGRGSS